MLHRSAEPGPRPERSRAAGAIELAERWSMSQATLRNWRFKGVGPRYFKPSGERGKALHKVEDVKAWEESRTGGGEA